MAADEAAALAALVAKDASVRQRLDVFLLTRGSLAAPFDDILTEPVPDRLLQTIKRARPVIGAAPAQRDWAERSRDAVRHAVRVALPDTDAWTLRFSPALAAGLALALSLAGAAGWIAGRSSGPSALIATSGSELVATGALSRALETTPGSKSYEAGGMSVVPVLTFRTTDDGVCREYRIKRADEATDLAGLACRTSEGAWRVALHVATPKPPSANSETPYQTASAQSVASVEALVDTLIAGDALGSDDEATLMRQGWQSSPHTP